MRARNGGGLAGAIVAIAGLAALGAEKNEKPKEPFFHQFLIPGDPLDEKLLAQEKRVAEEPGSASLRNDFGNLLAERRFPKEAREQYEKALKLDKTFFLPAYNLGMMEESEGRLGPAASAYREAIRRRRGFPPAHFHLGRVYEQQGRDDDAVEEFAKAIRIDGSMRDPKRNPLVVDSRLIDQASLVNYPRDVARAALTHDAAYVDVARFRPVPVTRPLAAEEVVEETGPQTIEISGARTGTGSHAPSPSSPASRGIRRAPRPMPPTPVPSAEPQPGIQPEFVPTPEPEPQR